MSNKLDNCNHKSLQKSVFSEHKVDEQGKFALHHSFKKGARLFKTDLCTSSAQRQIFAGLTAFPDICTDILIGNDEVL